MNANIYQNPVNINQNRIPFCFLSYCVFLLFFPQASFISSGNRTDISLDDPNFWQKWAKIAEVEIDSKSEKVRFKERNIKK